MGSENREITYDHLSVLLLVKQGLVTGSQAEQTTDLYWHSDLSIRRDFC